MGLIEDWYRDTLNSSYSTSIVGNIRKRLKPGEHISLVKMVEHIDKGPFTIEQRIEGLFMLSEVVQHDKSLIFYDKPSIFSGEDLEIKGILEVVWPFASFLSSQSRDPVILFSEWEDIAKKLLVFFREELFDKGYWLRSDETFDALHEEFSVIFDQWCREGKINIGMGY